jgi:hypothetical protein
MELLKNIEPGVKYLYAGFRWRVRYLHYRRVGLMDGVCVFKLKAGFADESQRI